MSELTSIGEITLPGLDEDRYTCAMIEGDGFYPTYNDGSLIEMEKTVLADRLRFFCESRL